MTKKLVVVAGPDAGREFILDDDTATWTVGRAAAVDARIIDPYISRLHFTLNINADGVFISDAGSKAGTRVGGVKISNRQLWHGDKIEIGRSSLRFESDQRREVAGGGSPEKKASEMFQPDEGMHALVGQTMGHFKLEDVVHSGRVSWLFRGQDQKHGRPVMVKVMYPSITSDDAHRNRFVRAVHSMINVRHPNLVEVYGAGKQGPYCWCAMEFVDGASLRDLIKTGEKDGRMGWRDVYRVAVHVARALECAHQQKVIHRNVSPSSLILQTDDAGVKLCDLFLAKALEGVNAEQLTAPGEAVGEVGYMAPEELVDSSKVDWRSDQYALGATLYKLLTGGVPFNATTVMARVRTFHEKNCIFPSDIQQEVNAEFLSIVLKMLAKSPDDRFALPCLMLDRLHRLGEQLNLPGVDKE